ncbi:MAG TPA: DUF2442 domain-containing protein [Phycisphaerales bacterium]|nr:DUF2442 domain-containing protein [Phycisphaerales bacterium]
MKSSKRGQNTSDLEVTNISQHGFWLWLNGTEYFLPFARFPWFKDATIAEITDVELLHGHHLHWPRLDVDLSAEMLQDPTKYPLVSK